MSLYLYILRHAETLEKSSSQTDLERELTPKAVQDATLLGQYMIEQKYIPDLILCSHAVRTQATARLINNSLHLMPEKIEVHRTLYHSNASDILRIVTGINQNTTDLMIIGHNPAISSFTNNLIDNDFLSFEPCSLAVIHFTSQKWSEISSKSGQLVLARKA